MSFLGKFIFKKVLELFNVCQKNNFLLFLFEISQFNGNFLNKHSFYSIIFKDRENCEIILLFLLQQRKQGSICHKKKI